MMAQDKVITLDVGGTIFRSTAATLLSHKPKDAESYFSALLSTGSANSFFIDRDPEYFRVVLNYLRDGNVWQSGLCMRRLKLEFSYYGLLFPQEFEIKSVALEKWMSGTPGEIRIITVTACDGGNITTKSGTEKIYAKSGSWEMPFESLEQHLAGKSADMVLLSIMGSFGWNLKNVQLIDYTSRYYLQFNL